MKTRTQEDFIKLSNELYHNKFKYSETQYVNNYTKVTITCPEHGDFAQTPLQHLRGNGCTKCTRNAKIEEYKASFIARANKIHGSKYQYDLSTYTSNRKPVKIICKKHGEFQQTTTNHLKGHGCRECQYELVALINGKSQEEFIQQANDVHCGFYSYDKTKYKNSHTNVTIKCPTHGYFKQNPTHHLKGHGCSRCAIFGFNKDKIGYLYYLSINNGQAYKIGITNKTVQERFTVTDLRSIEVLALWEFSDGAECYLAEQTILKQFKEFQYTGKKLLSSGNTELFNINIYKNYKEQINEITSMGEFKTP